MKKMGPRRAFMNHAPALSSQLDFKLKVQLEFKLKVQNAMKFFKLWMLKVIALMTHSSVGHITDQMDVDCPQWYTGARDHFGRDIVAACFF